MSTIFWNASVEEIKMGYIEVEDCYVCLICGKSFEKGRVFTDEDKLYLADKFIERHILKTHGSVFDFLLQINKKYTGLTDLQRTLLGYFYQGVSDQEIVKEIGGGSASTIRNHRFALREKEKQAKIFLAIMELLKGRMNNKMEKATKLVEIPRSANMVDERFAITEEEKEKYIKAYFKEGPDGPLSDFPTKEKRKIVVLRHIMNRFVPERRYSEKEINEILRSVYVDYVTLRRYLIEYGFMSRTRDGSQYWVKI
jgi:hypothetical protein